jgi:hypothetical protein
MGSFLAILLLGGTTFAQEAKVRAGELPPWPPANGTVKFVVDPPPFGPNDGE